MNWDKYAKDLSPYIPSESVSNVIKYIKENPFQLKITPNRKTKKGDFRPNIDGGLHRISVNGTLNKYEFLVTLIHEYAHLINWDIHGRNVKPHGQEWKDQFRKYLIPFVRTGCFPNNIEKELIQHLRSPSASSCVDQNLQKVFMKYDEGPEKLLLDSLEGGQMFLFRSRAFEKGEKRRTRIKCKDLSNQRYYLFSALTPVDLITEDSLLEK